MSDTYEFSRLDKADLQELVAIERECFSSPWGEKEFLLGLENKVFRVFGFKANDHIAAYISFHHIVDEMEILNIAVRPELRRQGLGRRLLGLVLNICRKMGIKTALLEVRESNVAARTLYGSFGFEATGKRKGYYPDNGEDAILMSLDLDNLGDA